MTSRPVEVIGHAGAAGFHPHNSAESLLKAIELGVDRIEVDILSAHEDILVLTHDSRLLLDGEWQETSQLSIEQLRSVLAGTLTLDEALELTYGNAPLLLDIKGRHYVGPLIRAIRDAPPGYSISACGIHARALRKLRKVFPEMSLGLSRGHSLTKISDPRLQRIVGGIVSIAQIVSLIAGAKWCGANEVMIQHHICTSPLVQAAQMAGLRVNTWTVDRPSDIHRVLKTGVDGVISNRPDLVIRAIEETGRQRTEAQTFGSR